MDRLHKGLLPTHDSLAELRQIPYRLVAQGTAVASPVVTVAIPTFRREELLVEAVRTVLAQDFDRPFELIVTDNDLASGGAEALLEQLPELRQRDFRYYVNGENVGGCHNVNRGIELARAPWVTILHDDDLLEPGFLTVSFRELEADPSIDGVVGAKSVLDQRATLSDVIAAPNMGAKVRAIARRGIDRLFYGGQSTRRLTARKLFWGPVAGNVVGFVFRKQAALELGGFDPSEEPNSDYWFYTRFAQRFNLRQHRKIIAALRVAVNESGNPATIRKMFKETYDFRRALTEGAVPRWWRYINPYLVARSRVELRDYWKVDVPAQLVSHDINHQLPKNRPYLIWTLKFILRGF